MHVRLGESLFALEIADTEQEHRRGLGGRSSVSEGTGMLFVFEDEEVRLFTMRDCVVPLDLIYLDADGVVVSVHEMSPERARGEDESAEAAEQDAAYDARLRGYMSDGAARFAIEVGGGTAARHGVRTGSTLVIPDLSTGNSGPAR